MEIWENSRFRGGGRRRGGRRRTRRDLELLRLEAVDLAAVRGDIRREHRDGALVCKLAGTVERRTVAACGEEILEVRHVGGLVHRHGEGVAVRLHGDARIDGDVLRDFLLDLVAFVREYPSLIDELLPFGVLEEITW